MMNVPMSQRAGFIWYDGNMVPWTRASLHVLTHGLHYGSSIFEGERVYDGHIFKSREHTQRLVKSAEILDFRLPFSMDEIEAAKRQAVAQSGLNDAYVRPLAWRGSDALGVSSLDCTIHLAIAVWDWPSYYEDNGNGIALHKSKWNRPPPNCAPVKAKAGGLYTICTLAKNEAMRAGCQDALMLDWEGYVAEATSANIFFVKNSRLHTPTADRFLNGITRQTVITMARDMGIDVVERRISPEEISSFDACFITGTAAEITSVGKIYDIRIGKHPIVENLKAEYRSLTRSIASGNHDQ